MLWGISYLNVAMLLTDAITIDYGHKNDTSSNSNTGSETMNFGQFMARMKQMKGDK